MNTRATEGGQRLCFNAVCLSVCLSVSRTSQKVMEAFGQKLLTGWVCDEV